MYVLYYASILWCWHLVWILVRTDYPCLGVGCHSWYQSQILILGLVGYNTTLTAIFSKTYSEDTLQCPYKDCSSLDRWQANKDLLSVFTFCNLFSTMTHLRQGKKVSILMLGDVNSGLVASRRGLLEAVSIMQ
jgi:hypothetical protein